MQDEFLTNWACLVKGLVLGAMKALTVECDAEVEFHQMEVTDPLRTSPSTCASHSKSNSNDGILITNSYIVKWPPLAASNARRTTSIRKRNSTKASSTTSPRAPRRIRTATPSLSSRCSSKSANASTRYLSLRLQASQDYLRKVIPIDEGKDSLAQTDLLIILNYFKQIAIYLIKTKLELEDRLAATEQSSQYESMIQKLEAEIRQHIRVEQQLRLYAETAQQKMDDLQSDKTQLGEQVKELNLQLATKIKELQQTQAQLSRQSLTRNSNRSNKLITEPMYAETDQREFTHIYTENSENSKQLT